MTLLDAIDVRVLGALLEKKVTTPEYYPLTLNALVNACNQKSNREPMVAYDEATVLEAIARLRAQGWALEITGAGNRVPKYDERFWEALNLNRREMAILTELMLRGPQTPGELRSRAERMHAFGGLDEVENCLRGLQERTPVPLVARLPRQPGTKEARHAHLLSGAVASGTDAPDVPVVPRADRLAQIEDEVRSLRAIVARLEQEWAGFRKQFE
ncbi:MAG: YceH family protein [Terriglobales bacterium]